MAAHASACATPRTAWPPPRRSLNYSTDKSGLFVAVAFRIAHQCFRNASRIRANRLLEPVEKLSIFLEEGLCVLAPLADPLRIIAEPGTRFLHEPGLHAQVQDSAALGDAFAIHDVALPLLDHAPQPAASGNRVSVRPTPAPPPPPKTP